MLSLIKNFLVKRNFFLRALIWVSDNIYFEHTKKDFRHLGENSIIHPNCFFSHKNRVIIKNNTQIHGGSYFHCQGGLYIGNNVGIAYGCTILTAEHKFRHAQAIPYDPSIIAKPVYINDNVWIGAKVCVMPGVEIGEGAIIGIGSVVTKSVPPCAIAFGNPATIMGYRDKEEYEKNKNEKNFVQHSYFDKVVVPKFVQIRPKLYNLVQPFIENNEMSMEENSGKD